VKSELPQRRRVKKRKRHKMAYTFQDVKYTTVGKGTKQVYDSKKIATWEHASPADMLNDSLEIVGGDFKVLQNVVKNALNTYQRFNDAPGADPVDKALAFLAKLGLSVEDLVK